jgi:DNA-binding NarL/FixJ family response regulator
MGRSTHTMVGVSGGRARGNGRPTRITVLDGHELFAETLGVALTMAGHEVHRVSPNDQALPVGRLVEAVRRSRSRVLLLDPDLEECDAAEVIRTLAGSRVIVVVLTADVDRARWGEWLWLGADIVMSKSEGLQALLSALGAIGEGREMISRDERDRLVELYHKERPKSLAYRAQLWSLTHREREVLSHLIYGDSVSDIARVRVVSEATVRTQVKSILAKLGVTSQLAAVSVAYRARWRPPHPAELGRRILPEGAVGGAARTA